MLHFAAYAYVGESVADPAMYYCNNVGDSLSLLEALKAEGERRGTWPLPLVFSSTCATYGIPDEDQIPIAETCPHRPINPYGRSKCMVEQMISDFGAACGLPSMIFRYFNAAGADPAGDLGEDRTPEMHLIPLVFDAIKGRIPQLQVFGDDYATPDGTSICDYIHVFDLADAHVLGLKSVMADGGQQVFNLGTQQGASVQEVIDLAEQVTGQTVPCCVVPRRPVDPPVLVADATRARHVLARSARYSVLASVLGHAWAWHSSQRTAFCL